MRLVDWFIRRVRPAVKRVGTQPASNSIYLSVESLVKFFCQTDRQSINLSASVSGQSVHQFVRL